ncbi:MAG: NifB/NifX family molybdenum-iron cluster-binding protein [Desulfobacterales bacterium]|nr:NifB/NifX family molybdenum-iron cluster-binding protein [Desulfobacterales bacterium]
MKIAFPTQDDQGMESLVHGHFGTARHFVIVDSDTGAFNAHSNPDADHLHGECQPINALNGAQVNAVVVGGIGAGALRKLRQGSIQVFRGVEGTVSENLGLINAGKLPEFAFDQVCGGHGIDGGCAH